MEKKTASCSCFTCLWCRFNSLGYDSKNGSKSQGKKTNKSHRCITFRYIYKSWFLNQPYAACASTTVTSASRDVAADSCPGDAHRSSCQPTLRALSTLYFSTYCIKSPSTSCHCSAKFFQTSANENLHTCVLILPVLIHCKLINEKNRQIINEIHNTWEYEYILIYRLSLLHMVHILAISWSAGQAVQG